MTDLVEFLKARLDEDEQVARAATEGPWSIDSKSYAETIRSADSTNVVAGGRWGDEASVFETTEDAIHIARHDPARVLREVGAKRKIIERYEEAASQYWNGTEEERALVLRPVLHDLALPYADHPDYKSDWAITRERA